MDNKKALIENYTKEWILDEDFMPSGICPVCGSYELEHWQEEEVNGRYNEEGVDGFNCTDCHAYFKVPYEKDFGKKLEVCWPENLKEPTPYVDEDGDWSPVVEEGETREEKGE